MAATETLSQLPPPRNSSEIRNAPVLATTVPRSGVVTLYGYGIKVSLERGHLFMDDGIGPARRQYRLPRVGHGLRRFVVIGSDGMVSLSALRWLADQDAAFVMLDRDGSVLATTGPVRPSDARLRGCCVIQSSTHPSTCGRTASMRSQASESRAAASR